MILNSKNREIGPPPKMFTDALTFDVVPEDCPVVVPPGADGERGAGVGLAALVPRDHLHLARVAQPRPRDLKPPHAVVEQLVAASL